MAIICIELTNSDWIELIGIIINSLLAIWIVVTIQSNLNNRRVLKDHFICEIKNIRDAYKNQLNIIYSEKCVPQDMIPWFKLMNIKINDIMKIISKRYKIDIKKLEPYQLELRNIVTENEDFISQFKKNEPMKISSQFKNDLIKFQQTNNYIFNDLIILINDH